MFLKAGTLFQMEVTNLSWDKLKPEEKVNLAIGMTDVCAHICADAVSDQNRDLKEEELMERVRERISFGKPRQHGVQKLENFKVLVRRIVNSLNAAELDYMFTGALAASYYGTPRTTTDVDVVVKVAPEKGWNVLASTLQCAKAIFHERQSMSRTTCYQ